MSLCLAAMMLFLSGWVRGTLPATLGAVNGQGGRAFPCQRARGDTVRRALAVVLKTGDTTASFTYRVLYTDADRDAPLGGAPCLHILEHGGEINGSPFIMTFERGPYTTGALYTYSATLLRGRAYTYYFDATDTTGRQAVATPIAPSPTAPIAGPQLLLPNGDVNKDGHMTPADALCIFRAFMRLPSCMD